MPAVQGRSRGVATTKPNMAPTTNRANSSCRSLTSLIPSLSLCGSFVSAFWATVTNQLLLLSLVSLALWRASVRRPQQMESCPLACVCGKYASPLPALPVHFVSPFSVHFLCQFAFLALSHWSALELALSKERERERVNRVKQFRLTNQFTGIDTFPTTAAALLLSSLLSASTAFFCSSCFLSPLHSHASGCHWCYRRSPGSWHSAPTSSLSVAKRN